MNQQKLYSSKSLFKNSFSFQTFFFFIYFIIDTIYPKKIAHFYIATHCIELDNTSWKTVNNNKDKLSTQEGTVYVPTPFLTSSGNHRCCCYPPYVREAAKTGSFLGGPATKRGGRVRTGPLKKILFFCCFP